MYNEYEIRPMPLSVVHCKKQVETFLHQNGLHFDELDYYACIFSIGDEDTPLAGGGLKGNVIKCIAVEDAMREEGFSSRLISHLISEANLHGYDSVKVYTKPENRDIFESMGFQLIAKAQKAILMENGTQLRHYCQYLSSLRRLGRSGIIVMNANPFTRGHRYLIEEASKQVEWLHVIVVKDDDTASRSDDVTAIHFPYAERKSMIESGTSDLHNVTVVEGSSYQVSEVTFPTYFLKEQTEATDTHISLDLDLFVHFIAPHLGAQVRFVGSEPTDPLTNLYNKHIKKILPKSGYEVIELQRLTTLSEEEGNKPIPISASQIRLHLLNGELSSAFQLAYTSSYPFLLAQLAVSALEKELATTPKPGLVDKHDSGAHNDMDYRLMRKSILTLRTYFTSLYFKTNKPDTNIIKTIGLEAETSMLNATNGVNTHKGALFALGITLSAASSILQKFDYYKSNATDLHSKDILCQEKLQYRIIEIASAFQHANNTHGAQVRERYSVKGALEHAQDGYSELFSSWLPFFRSLKGNEWQLHKTLLMIMSTLDDTNILYRKGAAIALQVKQEARKNLNNFSIDNLRQLNAHFTKENISPGGSADMLALTIFIDSILN